MKARLLPPQEPYMGNLIWNPLEADAYSQNINESLEALREIGYWVSPFPEGDGITFKIETCKKANEEFLADFKNCLPWAEIVLDLSFDPVKERLKPKDSKLTFEMNVRLRKSEIAMIQLEEAIDLFMSGKRISVITLAGAADGIFSGILEQLGEVSAADDTWAQLEERRSSSGIQIPGVKKIGDAFYEWNYFRNRLKHHDKKDEEYLEFSAFDQAYYAIQRANADAKKLGLKARNLQEYENWIIETLCL